MTTQTRNGKAFEYAMLMSIYNALCANQSVQINEDSAFANALECFNQLSTSEQENNNKAAIAAVNILLQFEPQLEHHENNEPLHLSLQQDNVGISGDVRDILTIRSQNNWEIGISCKHNHKAVKHSRLSDVNDFGKSWFDINCSDTYFNEIKPLFEELRQKKQNQELWRNIPDKEDRYYVPLLNSFIDELKRLDNSNPNIIPEKLIKYLLGSHDFYKVVTDSKKRITYVFCFSLYGTLNRSSGKIKPRFKFQTLTMPKKILEICFKKSSKNTILVTCDNGWSISMRIHNASSKVEPSLKFDVNLVGQPSEMHSTFEPWKNN